MHSEISTYLDLRIAEVNNSGLAYIKPTFAIKDLPESQKEKSYMLKLDAYSEDETVSAKKYIVNAVVELSFLCPNNDLTKYQGIIDNYIHVLVKQIKRFPNYVYSSLWTMEVKDITVENLNEFPNDELKCNLNLEIDVYDYVTVDTNPPDAPTLTSPANGATNGTTGQSFNWTGTADKWHIIIYQGSTTVINQDGLTLSSFTVPADGALTDAVTYSWKARGWNAGGYGEWSSLYTFTVNDSPALPEVPTLTSPLGTTDNDLTATFVWALSENSTSYDIQVSGDSGFSSLLLDNNVTATTANYTFESDGTYYWRVRGVNEYGSSDWADSSVVILQFAYEQQTTDFISWLSVAPDTTRKGHINTLIKGLKDANVWDRLDVLQMYQSHSITSNDWGKNWRKNAYHATAQGAVGLTIDAPVTTSGATYIKTGFTPSTDGIGFTKDRASVGVKMLNETTSSGFDIGFASLTGTGYIRMQFRNGSNQYAIRLNTIGGAVLSGANTVSKAFHIVTRSSSSAVSYYKDGTLVVAGTGQDAGTIPTTEIYVGNGEGSNYRAGSWGCFFAGTHMSATDITNLVTLVNAYYTNIGAQV